MYDAICIYTTECIEYKYMTQLCACVIDVLYKNENWLMVTMLDRILSNVYIYNKILFNVYISYIKLSANITANNLLLRSVDHVATLVGEMPLLLTRLPGSRKTVSTQKNKTIF